MFIPMNATKINQFDRTNLRALQADIDAALAAMAEKHGIQIKAGGASFGATAATFKVELAVIGDGGVAKTRHATEFELFASSYGLAPTDLGREFTYKGNGYKITGLSTKSRRFPVEASRTDGRTFKFPAELVKLALSK